MCVFNTITAISFLLSEQIPWKCRKLFSQLIMAALAVLEIHLDCLDGVLFVMLLMAGDEKRL